MPVAVGAASLFTTRKVAAYGFLSTLAAFAVVLGAFRQRPNFYSAAVMLGRSNGCMMVLFNFGLFLTLCFGKLCQKVFFGPLRAIEVEHLYERSWYAITESLLAMTIFRDEFGANFVILFSTLLFLKVFHWLSADRVEFMEQTPSVTRLFHTRMVSVLWTLFGLDLFLVAFAVEVLILDKNRMGIMIMFASEFMILSATLWSTIAKYIINVIDSREEEPWEGKSMYVFFVDLATDFLKLMTYVTFFALILSFYGLPLNIIRDVFLTARSFFGRVRDFIKYRAATKNMDTRFPDATHHDLSVMSDGTCIICREEMMARAQEGQADDGSANALPRPERSGGLNETPKKLPCGHIFHFHCLRSWLERQQSCPTCRRTVFASPDPQPTVNSNANGQAGGAMRNNVVATGGSTRNTATGTDTGVEGGANATQTARDRLQGFLQQLQSDAQRVREQANLQTPRATPTQQQVTPTPPPLSSSSMGGATNANNETRPMAGRVASDPLTTARTRLPVQKTLINSLFGQSEGATGRRGGVMDVGSSSASQGIRIASRTEQKDDLVSSLVPPAPWTLRPNKMGINRSGSPVLDNVLLSENSEASAEPSSVPTDVSSKEEVEGKDSLDPVDAREAARAATLKRFGLQNTSTLSSSKVQSGLENGKGKQRAEESKTSMPGDPVLIPLFDPSKVASYEADFATNLPFPLARSEGQATSFLSNVGANLISADSLLPFSADQLRTLSLNSRKGLEERLRLLTRVEGAIEGLVEDLTRALSVLPASDDVDEDQVQPPAPSQTKGKEAAEGIHMN